jgi:dTDP-4-amino-4,6-dideoxygalactose transaminase
VVEPGFKYNMTDLQAALGIHQLARVEENHARREEVWARYDEAFADLPLVLPAPVPEGTRHARHLYTPLLDLERLGVDRDRFVAALQAEGVGTGIHYRAIHLHHWYRETFGFRPEDFLEAWWISERTLSLPLGPALGDADVEDVVRAVRKVALAYRR